MRLQGDDGKPANGEEPIEGEQGTVFTQLRDLLPGPATVQITEDHVHSLLSARRGRESLFGRHLFSDPAWDVILELYAARLGNRRLSISDLARSIGVAQSVIARWTNALIDAGIVSPEWDHNDMEATTLELTREGASKMAQLAEQWGSAFVAI